MDQIWFFPLLPSGLFLGGALLLNAFFGRRLIPGRSLTSLGICLLVFAELMSRVFFGQVAALTAEPVVLSGWGLGSALTMRVDGLSMAFLFIPVLLLIALFWARRANDHVVLLILAGSAAAVFVAANGISFSYALLLFDAVGCYVWLRQGYTYLALARLLLAFFTTGALMLAGLSVTAPTGLPLLAFALWLRVGLFPFLEITYAEQVDLERGDMMIWLALSTAVGVYVAARFLTVPLPQVVLGLMVLLMLLNAWLAWLIDAETMHLKLLRMILVQPGLALLIAPISARLSIVLGLVYTLALATLWLMPQVGRPNLLERHWLWVYAAPILATLSLLGFPGTFGWAASERIYADLLRNNQQFVATTVLLAEGIAFSALYEYWTWLLRGREGKGIALRATLVLAFPFLVPWVAGLTFSVVTGLDLSVSRGQMAGARGSPVNTGLILFAIWLLALGFGYGRSMILDWLKITPQSMIPILGLSWLWSYVHRGLAYVSQGALRTRSILEGAHYLGWAVLVALAGLLVVILN